MALTTPLSGNFDLRDVQTLFALTNRPTGLRGMYTRAFGSVTNGVSSMRDFDGAGRPQVTDTTSGSQAGLNVIISFSLTLGLAEDYIRVEYANNLNDLGTVNSTFTSTWTYTTGGSKEITLPIADDTYYYRIEFWNNFNDQHVDDREFTPALSVVIVPPTLSTPGLLSSITYNSIDNSYGLSWTTTGDEPTGYGFEYRVNSGTWVTPSVVNNKVNWNTSSLSTKSADIGSAVLPDPSDIYEFRLRATRSGYTTSAWSNIETYNH